MGRRGSSESGAALLEAVVALAAVATVVVGGTELHRATVAARLDAERTVVALVAASATAERARLGPGPVEAGSVPPVRVPALWQRRSCDDGALALHEVPVRPDERDGVRGSLRVALRSVADDVVVAVRSAEGDPVPGATVVVTAADGDIAVLAADTAGCLVLGPVSGPATAVATSSAGATGRLAVPRADSDGTRVAGGARIVHVSVVGSGRVTVVVDSDGELPDAVEGGRLAWWRGGAAGGPVAAPGESMDLPEGRQGVVLGACADTRAGGSAAAVDVVPGGDALVTVPMGRVVVARPDVADRRRLVLRRQRPCPGAAARPVLVWDVGGGGGPLAAAVPDGEWEAVLEAADGRRLAGPVTVRVSGDSEAVPSW